MKCFQYDIKPKARFVDLAKIVVCFKSEQLLLIVYISDIHIKQLTMHPQNNHWGKTIFTNKG